MTRRRSRTMEQIRADERAAQEAEANAFAYALLMPADLLRRDCAGHTFDIAGDPFIKELAHRYKVDEEVMTLRLVQLGLIRVPGWDLEKGGKP